MPHTCDPEAVELAAEDQFPAGPNVCPHCDEWIHADCPECSGRMEQGPRHEYCADCGYIPGVTGEPKPDAGADWLKVGHFEYNRKTNALRGPAAYLKERGNQFVRNAIDGKSTVLNFAMRQGYDPDVSLLVALQTDFAAWLGAKRLGSVL